MQIPGRPARHSRLFQVISRPTPAPAEPTKGPPQSRLTTLIAEGVPAPRPQTGRLADWLTGQPIALWGCMGYHPSATVPSFALRFSWACNPARSESRPFRTVQESGSTVPETCLRLGHLVRLFPATMSFRMISATCLFAPGDPAAETRLLPGCRWDGAVPRIPPASVWDRGPAKTSASKGHWHMLPFRSIPLLP